MKKRKKRPKKKSMSKLRTAKTDKVFNKILTEISGLKDLSYNERLIMTGLFSDLMFWVGFIFIMTVANVLLLIFFFLGV